MSELLIHESVPEIIGDRILYKGREYKLIRMSKEAVEKTGTPLEISEGGLLKIAGNKVWSYGIPDEYLCYILINEIGCPDVLAGEGLCLEGLKIELKTIPLNRLNNYLLWRIDFFRNMKKYYQIDEFEDRFYADEMKKCYEYLEELEAKRNVIGDIMQSVIRTLESNR